MDESAVYAASMRRSWCNRRARRHDIALVAQWIRALVYETKGCEFESHRAHQIMWNWLQRQHDRLGKYLNGRKNLSWAEARRWGYVSQAIMWLQEKINLKRCAWKKI